MPLLNTALTNHWRIGGFRRLVMRQSMPLRQIVPCAAPDHARATLCLQILICSFLRDATHIMTFCHGSCMRVSVSLSFRLCPCLITVLVDALLELSLCLDAPRSTPDVALFAVEVKVDAAVPESEGDGDEAEEENAKANTAFGAAREMCHSDSLGGQTTVYRGAIV